MGLQHSGLPGPPFLKALMSKRPLTDLEITERCEAPHPPGKPISGGADDKDIICDECWEIDWASVANLASRKRWGMNDCYTTPIRYLHGSHQDLAQSSCRVCRLFSYTVPTSKTTPSKIVAHKAIESLLQAPLLVATRTHDQCSLSLCTLEDQSRSARGRGVAAVLDDSWGTLDVEPRRLEPDYINYAIFRNLVTLCERDHTECRQNRRADNVPGLRVIDVRRKKVTSAPRRCQYFALSYVWGSTSHADLASPPLVIKDAMSVTAALGCKYLWVDRYVSLPTPA